jgi:protein-L-isoaspartate(D-aspartate) O-methyltransferase
MNDRQRMIKDIEREIRLTSGYTGIQAFDERVMAAMAQVPRHKFVPPELQSRAYDNGPLPIGSGQTISQPYIVALMTELLNPKASDVVLEVGTGSCYQSAVLSCLVKKVYSIEIIEELASQANKRLHQLGYINVEVLVGDGYYGWPEHAPYDGIIVTAAAPFIPQPLIDQLRIGARMVIPVGVSYGHQELMLIEKQKNGKINLQEILAVAFVPLTGDHHTAEPD